MQHTTNLVGLPLEYVKQALDKNHNGSISIKEAAGPNFSKYGW